MKIVVAFDSYKGSATSKELNEAVMLATQTVLPESTVQCFSIADGGEGSLVALNESLDGKWVGVETVDLLKRPIFVHYLLKGQQAFIESASVVGLDKLGFSPNSATFMESTSFGLGAVIMDAVRRGCKEIFITLGGTASSDGGQGLLESLQVDFNVVPFQSMLDGTDVKLIGLTDVSNVYAGLNGFAHVFGKQKGGTTAQIACVDAKAQSFVNKIKKVCGIDLQEIPGAGAAGGIGGAIALLGGRLEPGFQRIASIVGLEQAIRSADLVFTGEGRMDNQSQNGKVPYGVARLANEYNVPTIALCGSVDSSFEGIGEEFLAVFSIQTGIASIEEALEVEKTLENISFVTKNILNIIMK